MVWLALWCGSGAIVGWVIGSFRGRSGVGTVLGAFAGPFGWLMVLGAAPKARAVAALPHPVSSAVAESPRAQDAENTVAISPQWISWTASVSGRELVEDAPLTVLRRGTPAR